MCCHDCKIAEDNVGRQQQNNLHQTQSSISESQKRPHHHDNQQAQQRQRHRALHAAWQSATVDENDVINDSDSQSKQQRPTSLGDSRCRLHYVT